MNDFLGLGQIVSHPGSLLMIYSDRKLIKLDPEYQRVGGVWTREKKQLLIDSLINGFDIPKLYLQEFTPPKNIDGHAYKFAIIDGKQRLQAIWDFIDGKFPLADDFKYLRDSKVQAGGLKYDALSAEYPYIKSQFDAYSLHIVMIKTDDTELIEELFSRLNEAVPLNAPEKRRALGGPLPPKIDGIAEHQFFKNCLPFPDNRYRHKDLAAKFLYIEHKDCITNTKKSDLDKFVTDFKLHQATDHEESIQKLSKICTQVQTILDMAKSLFSEQDRMLRRIAMVTVYYHLWRGISNNLITLGSDQDLRTMLVQFESDRDNNRKLAEEKGESASEVNTELLEFDKHSQTPNDAYAIRIRLEILLWYLKKKFQVNWESKILDNSPSK